MGAADEVNSCGGSSTLVALPAFAQSSNEARFMRVNMGGEVIAQLAYKTGELCQRASDASKQQAANGAPLPNGVTFGCSPTDVSSILLFETAVRDEYFGHEMVLAAKTEMMCQNMSSGLTKQLVIGTNRPQFSTLIPCKLRG